MNRRNPLRTNWLGNERQGMKRRPSGREVGDEAAGKSTGNGRGREVAEKNGGRPYTRCKLRSEGSPLKWEVLEAAIGAEASGRSKCNGREVDGNGREVARGWAGGWGKRRRG